MRLTLTIESELEPMWFCHPCFDVRHTQVRQQDNSHWVSVWMSADYPSAPRPTEPSSEDGVLQGSTMLTVNILGARLREFQKLGAKTLVFPSNLTLCREASFFALRFVVTISALCLILLQLYRPCYRARVFEVCHDFLMMASKFKLIITRPSHLSVGKLEVPSPKDQPILPLLTQSLGYNPNTRSEIYPLIFSKAW